MPKVMDFTEVQCSEKNEYMLLTEYDILVKAIDCGKLLAPRNGSMVGKETTYPNSLKFSCDEGFILSGSWLRKCQTNGTWSGNETKCQGLINLPSFNF